jgi:hypothetical protein
VRNSFDGSHGYLRAPDGNYRDLGALPFDNPMTTAMALNNCNQVTGASGPLLFPEQPLHSYLWTKGKMLDLGGFGWEPNAGLAVNDRGQVTGYASLQEGFHTEVAFLYSEGKLLNIDGRPDTEERWSGGTGINKHGHVVGYSNHLSGFIYRGKHMISLNTLIDAKPGWDIRAPKGINDAGQIAATAYRGNVSYAVRLDPIRQGAGAPLPTVLDEPAEATGPEAEAAEAALPVEQPE